MHGKMIVLWKRPKSINCGFRLTIPHRYRVMAGRTEIKKSLGITDLRGARLLRAKAQCSWVVPLACERHLLSKMPLGVTAIKRRRFPPSRLSRQPVS